jgi:hypothetical protein
MIINARTAGPRYSTDATASDLSRFMTNHHAIDATEPRAAVTEAPAALEDLYPSLFATPQPNVAARAFDSVRLGFATVVATILHRQPAVRKIGR